ncbi:MAG: sulfatase [Victivallaceae bacterium]|nr:sulfatase [Victivallaceae bacterium]
MSSQPANVIIVFGDQWRAQAFGYAGNKNVATPNIDTFSEECINFTNAVSGCPVCTPYRGSLLKGQYPVTHGAFLNDVCLNSDTPAMAETFTAAGYDTAYIGKWHLDGHGRSRYIPRERRQGFDYWKVLECTHTYNHSSYYAGDETQLSYWNGYDALAQTEDAISYIEAKGDQKPFLLLLSWGPPHAPYNTAPERFQQLYKPENILLRPNVPDNLAEMARQELAGYYAHCSALDYCFGLLTDALKMRKIYDNTTLLFTSDHGDMLYSQGEEKKQRPWDESIRVPFLLKPAGEFTSETVDAPIDAPDVMPTLLGMNGVTIPDSVEGHDFSGYILGSEMPGKGAALLSCPHPFGRWNRSEFGGFEYRGLRTARYTYVKGLSGSWLLYDNQTDPFQQQNLIHEPEYGPLIDRLEATLTAKLQRIGDEFLSGTTYLKRWNHTVDELGTVAYEW